jgi:uncharacterized protein involved in exopolysaccharide biosynthesis
MAQNEAVPFDYEKSIELTRDQRTMLEGEISVIDRTITLRRKDLKTTGFVDNHQIRDLKIRRHQKQQRRLTLNLRILDMNRKMKAQEEEL